MTDSPITDWITRLSSVQGEARLTLLHELRERPEEYDAVVLRLLASVTEPIPLLLWCPICHARHIDVGEFATKPHHTHACQGCGLPWRPALGDTVGVQFLPGYKNEPEPDALVRQRRKEALAAIFIGGNMDKALDALEAIDRGEQ